MRLVTLLAISVAALSPIVAIVLLNALRGNALRLGLMALFTVVFCVLCSFFTGAKKTELLAASAACVLSFPQSHDGNLTVDRFAAVQVVFISGDDCPRRS